MKLYFDLIDEYNLNLPFRRSIVTPVYSIGNSNLFVIIIPLFEPVAAPRDNHFMGAILVFCDINDFIKFFPESNIPTLLEQNGQVLLSNNEVWFLSCQERAPGNSDIVEFAMETQLVNLLQSLFETQGEKCYKTPTFYVFKLFKEHLSQYITPIYQDSPNPMIDCVASVSEDSRKLVVTVVNKDLYNYHKLCLKFDALWHLKRTDIIWTPNVC